MGPEPWKNLYPTYITGRERMEPVRIPDMLAQSAKRWPDRCAIEFYGTRLTYRELHRLSLQAAHGFSRLGVSAGTRVAIHLSNSPHFAVVLFGVLLAGGCVVPISPLAAPDQILGQLEDSGAEMVVTADWLPGYRTLHWPARLRAVVVCALEDFLPAALVAKLLPGLAATAPRGLSYQELLSEGPCPPHVGSVSDLAVIQYTGGTTGEPKGAMLSHGNLSAAAFIHALWLGPDAVNERVLGVLPLTHIYGLSVTLLRSLAMGFEIVLHLRFDAGLVLEDIAEKRISELCAVPAMFFALVSHPNFAATDFSSLERCVSGGAPLPYAVRREFEGRTGVTLHQGYGLTETASLAVNAIPDAGPATAGECARVGVPPPFTTLEIVDLETGLKPLPVGAVGEVCISGPQVMQGYWNKPEETAVAFRGGRFHTGDVGYIEPTGHLSLVDRRKEMILVGGHNVFPSAIEAALAEHPSIAQVAVIGMPHSHFGEIAKAVVTLKPGTAALSYSQMCEFLRTRLSSVEIPARLEIRGSLPQTPLGKISKKELRNEQVAAGV